MSRLAALILLAAMSVVSALASAEFDQRVLVGEWAAYDSSWVHGASYTYLRLDERLAGVYAYAYNGGEPILLQFRIADVTASDGFVAITLRRGDDPPFKLVLSAFRAKDDMAGGLATGALYMYRSHGE